MPELTCLTAGESHGPAVIALLDGLPADAPVDVDFINAELSRRQGGYGRGGRQKIEHDAAEFLSGVRLGRTIGSPVAIRIANRDSRLDDLARTPPLHRPRPGHADLAGSIKYLTPDCRPILERASARETAGRAAAGALCRCFLRELGIEVFAFVRSVLDAATDAAPSESDWRGLRAARDDSETYCPDPDATQRQMAVIRRAKIDKDTVGGLVEAHVFGCPPGLGSCMQWRDKLDARLAYAAMSIQAIKSVEIGLGKDVASRSGSNVHDPIRYDPARLGTRSLGFTRDSNNAGGTEGGMSNGMPIVVRAAMKPISTLLRGLPSVDLTTRQPDQSQYERSDVCAVPAASVVLENVVGFEIARAVLRKFGGDTLDQTRGAMESFLAAARTIPLDPPTHTIA